MDKAYKLLLDQEQKKRALDVIQAGKEYVEHTVSIYSAAVFTGSISTPWAPCRRVNVHADIATPAWPDCSCGLHSFAVAVALRIARRKLAFTPSAEGAWPGRCTYLFPQQSHVWKALPVLSALCPVLRVEQWSRHAAAWPWTVILVSVKGLKQGLENIWQGPMSTLKKKTNQEEVHVC